LGCSGCSALRLGLVLVGAAGCCPLGLHLRLLLGADGLARSARPRRGALAGVVRMRVAGLARARRRASLAAPGSSFVAAGALALALAGVDGLAAVAAGRRLDVAARGLDLAHVLAVVAVGATFRAPLGAALDALPAARGLAG